MTEREKIHAGVIYQPNDPEIMREQLVYFDKLKVYNDLPHTPMDMRENMLKEMFAEVGENCYVESPSMPTGAGIMSIWEAMYI